MTRSRSLVAVLLIALIAAFFIFRLDQYLSLDTFKSQQTAIDAWYRAHPWQTGLIYFLAYVAVTFYLGANLVSQLAPESEDLAGLLADAARFAPAIDAALRG